MARGHAFISYVRADSLAADELQHALQAAGVQVWRDTSNLWPGQDWQAKIREAIISEAFAFIACFSRQSLAREKSYQNEELALAIEQLRLRQLDAPWLIPVRLDECVIPDYDLGGGRRLSSVQRADLFGGNRDEALSRLVTAVLRILGSPAPYAPSADSDATTWSHRASQVQSLRGTVGGNLYLTATRLLFNPNPFEAAVGGRQWSAPLSTIRLMNILPPDGNIFKGGLRNRLKIEFTDGSVQLFVVDQTNEVIRRIEKAISHLA